MPLTLTLRHELDLPIEVDGIVPGRLQGLSAAELQTLPVWCGRVPGQLTDFFDIDGVVDESASIHWQGDLGRVGRIGQGMARGSMTVNGAVGHHAGFQMSGGRLEVFGDAHDYLGAEMTGGTIVLAGNAADHVGGCFSGAKFGMNRGEIFIQGHAGQGVGQSMRRGTIVVGQTAGKLTGWNMRAGTIICFDGCGPHPGAGMKRGTVVASTQATTSQRLIAENIVLPSFVAGASFTVPVFQLIKNWLVAQQLAGQPIFSLGKIQALANAYQVFHGDQLTGGRGELFFAAVA